MEVVRTPCDKANGLVLDRDGELVACDQITSRVVRYRRDGGTDVLALHHEGRYLNSPNDIVVRGADGALYFTDPDYGRWNDWIGCERHKDASATVSGLGFRGLFRVAPDGDLELVVDEDEFDEPNGLCFSPDERLLYVNDSSARNVKVFDVAPDGSLGNRRIIAEGVGTGVPREGNVDGMECDEQGNVWVTGPGGVWVLTPEGEHLGTVATPEVCGSLCWGGRDMHSLFLVTSTTAHVVETMVGPAPLPPF
jgi:gluconolactonase